jgi:hypothetical protein
MPACTALLSYHNPFVDLYWHMFIATLAFVTQVEGFVLLLATKLEGCGVQS